MLPISCRENSNLQYSVENSPILPLHHAHWGRLVLTWFSFPTSKSKLSLCNGLIKYQHSISKWLMRGGVKYSWNIHICEGDLCTIHLKQKLKTNWALNNKASLLPDWALLFWTQSCGLIMVYELHTVWIRPNFIPSVRFEHWRDPFFRPSDFTN